MLQQTRIGQTHAIATEILPTFPPSSGSDAESRTMSQRFLDLQQRQVHLHTITTIAISSLAAIALWGFFTGRKV